MTAHNDLTTTRMAEDDSKAATVAMMIPMAAADVLSKEDTVVTTIPTAVDHSKVVTMTHMEAADHSKEDMATTMIPMEEVDHNKVAMVVVTHMEDSKEAVITDTSPIMVSLWNDVFSHTYAAQVVQRVPSQKDAAMVKEMARRLAHHMPEAEVVLHRTYKALLSMLSSMLATVVTATCLVRCWVVCPDSSQICRMRT